ncbi:tagaturonate reductase [Bacteroidota bacterium]
MSLLKNRAVGSDPAEQEDRTESNQLPERVLQFGTGRFAKGFVDYFIHKANQQGLFDGRIVCVQSTGSGRANLLNAQGGRFNIWIRGIEHGETIDHIETVESISRVIPALEQWDLVLQVARDPSIEIVTMIVSEIGMVLDTGDAIDASPPRSFGGKLTAVLYERARCFDYAPEAGLVMLPCELIENNGDLIRHQVLELAQAWGLEPAFTEWIESANVFCNTLVDRIVTGTPSESDLAAFRSRLGYDDPMVTVTEPYRLWAIEGDDNLRDRLKFPRVDPGIIVTDDIGPFRERKLRLLNGGHSLTVPLGILHGNKTVLDNMEHPVTGPFIERILREEIGPTLPVEFSTIEPYIDEILERWRNKFLDHNLSDIVWQSTTKLRHRVIPTIRRFYEKFGHAPKQIAEGFAAYLIVTRPEYAIVDDSLEIPRAAWARAENAGSSSIRSVVDDVCSSTELWEFDLSTLEGFVDEVSAHVEALLQARTNVGETVWPLPLS